ncbi:MAG TPA: hypothetical protein VGB45_01940 [Abditibacterium sp.]|jgi:hypothetical protein
MKLRPVLAVFPFLFVSAVAQSQGARTPVPLKISLAAEEPTGVFFDRDTLLPQTPLLFTARIDNPSTEARQVELEWKITDAAGRIRLERESKFTVNGGDSIVRRELFDAPARGGYLLETLASSKVKGPDIQASAALPFAVTVAPLPGSSAARPQSFFVLSTPTLLSGEQLDFYGRLGARVLRSPLPPDPARPDWPAIEAQLGERLKRNLATIALLPLSDERGSRSDTFFARSVPSTLTRYSSLTTWELAGEISPADLDAWSQVARSRRRDIALLGPFPRGLDDGLPVGASIKINALEGATFNWPRSSAHPTALRRLWLSRAATTRNAGLPAFHLRRDGENLGVLPASAASELTQDYLSAIMAGASSMSETLSPPEASLAGAGQMARGAAFSMLSRTLEDAAFREELFPRSPAFEGALFRAPRGSIAILYATRDIGKMVARIAPARCYDVFGNPIASDERGTLEIPLSGQPIFVLSDVPTDVLSFALRNAQISGVRPLEAQFLPLSRVPGSGPGSLAVRVRLQNIGLGDQSGQIKLVAPKGWKLANPRYDFRLAEGESKTYEFRATDAPFNPKWPLGRVPLEVSFGGKIKNLEAEVPISSALSVSPDSAPKLDGNLRDWDEALWQIAAPNSAGVSAKVALRWDKNRLYLAAQVRETGLSPRRADETSYDFWRDYDALQFAFGTSDGPETVPSAGPFRDSDRGFLLSPFGRSGANEYTGRVLKLWGPDKPYNSVADRVRWGGAVAGASCFISRDETAGVTNYEAQIPFAALPDLNPVELAAKDGAVRFGWILHNDEGQPLDPARAAGSFPWWANTATFLPEGRLSSPLRSTLGFTLSGPLENAGTVVSTQQPPAPTVLAPIATPPASDAPRPILVPSTIAPTPVPTPAKPVVQPTPAPLPPGVPAPSGPLQPRPTPREPLEIAPFIVPSEDAQPLPPAAP